MSNVPKPKRLKQIGNAKSSSKRISFSVRLSSRNPALVIFRYTRFATESGLCNVGRVTLLKTKRIILYLRMYMIVWCKLHGTEYGKFVGDAS